MSGMMILDNIKIVHCVDGDEFLAEISFNEVTEKYLVKNAIRIVMIPNQSQQNAKPSVGFAPFHPFMKRGEEFFISQENIIWTAAPSDEFRNHYAETFNPSFIVPSASKLIT